MILGDSIFLIIEIICLTALIFVSYVSEKYVSNKWKLAYLAPLFIAILCGAFFGVDKALTTAYVGSVIIIVGFFVDKKRVRQLVIVVSLLLFILTYQIVDESAGYRHADYVEDFNKGFSYIKEHYILSEYKEIDYDALYQKYLPRFEEADKNHDEVENCIAWNQFCNEFYDGHVYFCPDNEETMDEATKRKAGNDYGLAVVKLTNGKYVAVNVDESSAAYRQGIHNGTELVRWDGRSIDDILDELDYQSFSTPDKDNESFYAPLWVGGVGEEKINVTFIDDSSKEQEITLSKLGDFDIRMKETLDIIDDGYKAGNMSFTEIDDETVLFRIKTMMYDMNSAKSEDYTGMQSTVRESLLEYKAKGKKKIIIDLRNNGGGAGLMVKALVELFAEEGEHLYSYDGVWNDALGNYEVDKETGKYVKGKAVTYMGEDIWSHGEIVILVNGQSASAADHLPTLLRGQDNVTVMGFTESCGAAQGVVSQKLESGTIAFSASVVLDENGDIMIDSGTDHESRNDIDIKIPFDEAAVKALFDAGEDYVLRKAIELK